MLAVLILLVTSIYSIKYLYLFTGFIFRYYYLSFR